MTEAPVVFLDSGIGGLPYLKWVSDRVRRLPLVYIADTRYFPYGELPEDEVRRVVVETSKKIFETLKPAMLVIACNTASVAALQDVRDIAACPIVGTVPAVKPAAASGGKTIGVLATERTVESPYLDNLVTAFASGSDVRRQAAGDIVRFVENRWLDEGDEGAVPVVLGALEKLKSYGVDTLVIGCTHFLHVLPVLSDIMGRNVRMVDSRDGVGRRILSLMNLEVDDPAGESDSAPTDRPVLRKFYVTESGESDSRYRRFSREYGLQWSGEL